MRTRNSGHLFGIGSIEESGVKPCNITGTAHPEAHALAIWGQLWRGNRLWLLPERRYTLRCDINGIQLVITIPVGHKQNLLAIGCPDKVTVVPNPIRNPLSQVHIATLALVDRRYPDVVIDEEGDLFAIRAWLLFRNLVVADGPAADGVNFVIGCASNQDELLWLAARGWTNVDLCSVCKDDIACFCSKRWISNTAARKRC